jgi:gamma-glutamyl:cysteine ligase YbdK (ATP-grasp superfamily)
MDPLSLSVAILIANQALSGAAEEAGREAWGALGGLVAALRKRFSGDKQASRALTALEQYPADENRVQALAAAVDEQIGSDQAFRHDLEELIAAAKTDASVGKFVTNVCDQAQVGKIVNIGHARDVSF